MEGSFIAQNSAERERLNALVARLSDEELRRPIGHGWTVSVALAHLAYWDRKAMALRPRVLIRALHRKEHLDEIEQALAEV